MFQPDELREFNKSIIEEFRENAGIVGGMFEGANLLLLTTTGAKSGLSRTNPLAYMKDGERYIIFASYEGNPKNPPWYYNVKADPAVKLEVGSDSFTCTAREVDEPERTSLYASMVEKMPEFAEYESRTERTIPVIAVTRG